MAIGLDPVTSLIVGAVIVGLGAVAAWLLNRAKAQRPASAADRGDAAPPASCPACGQRVDPQATRCGSCRAFFEPDKFDCPACRADVPYGADACTGCGEAFSYGAEYLCPACSRTVPKETRHCPHCKQRVWSTIRQPTAKPPAP